MYQYRNELLLAYLIIGTSLMSWVMLSWLVMLRGLPAFYAITILVVIVNGMGTWLVGRPGMHVGASGLNFGYLGYLVAQDNLGVSFLSIGLAFVITLFEGACFWVDLPGFGLRYISWEGHSFGFLGGVLAGTYPILWLKLQAWYF